MGTGTTVEAGTGAIFMSDMDQCVPPAALSASPRRGDWRLIP